MWDTDARQAVRLHLQTEVTCPGGAIHALATGHVVHHLRPLKQHASSCVHNVLEWPASTIFSSSAIGIDKSSTHAA